MAKDIPQDNNSSSAEEEQVTTYTPLPMKQMIALAAVHLTESICMSMLLPFVGLYVVHLQHLTDTSEAGKASGVLVGVFMLGQVISGKLWGHLSDVYGRKMPLVVGLFVSAWCMLFFGLAPNIYVACLMRLLHGFSNGNILVAKTMVADITDKTNEAKGFAMVSVTWSLGNLIGPFIGGFLYGPVENKHLQWMHVTQDSFLGRNPAFLPSAVIFSYNMLALLICVFLVKESNANAKSITDAPWLRWFFSLIGQKSTAAAEVTVISDEANCIDERSSTAEESTTTAVTTTHVDEQEQQPKRVKLTYMQAMKIGAIRNITMYYMLLAASDMTYNEIFPLWGIADKDVGGLGLYSDAIGILMLSYSIPSVLANFGFHAMCKVLKSYILFWQIAMFLSASCTLIIPIGSSLGSGGFWYIMVWGIVRQIGISWGYSLVHLLTSKAAPSGSVGAVYGITQSCAAMTRCAVPFLAAPLFAWSISTPRSFPFNYWLLFLLSVIYASTSFVMSFFLSVELKQEEYDDKEEFEKFEKGDGHVEVAIEGDAVKSSDGRVESGDYLSMVASFCTNPDAEHGCASPRELDAEHGSFSSPKNHPIKAATQELLDALRQQRVEGTRKANLSDDEEPLP